MATEYIAHVTPGSASKNLAVTGIVFPSDALVMLINDAAMAVYSPNDAITTLPNQHINSDLAGFDYLGVSGGVDITLSRALLNGNKLIKMATRWIGVSGYYYYTRACLYRNPNGVTGYPYSPGISGVTRSILIYPDKTLFTGGDSQHKAAAAHAIGFMEFSPGQYSGLVTGTSSTQWLFYTGGAFDREELGLAPEINGEWYHFIIVETGGVDRKVQIYVNGILLFDASLPNRTLYPNIITLSHLNRRTNSIDASFNGYYAHGATWLKALSVSEINDVIKTINYEYGLTNPLVEV